MRRTADGGWRWANARRAMLGAALVGVLGGCAKKDADTPPTRPILTTEFDGQAALKYAAAQVAFGPRIPGTDAARKAGDWIAAQMRARGATVVEQTWTHKTKSGRALPLRNILARFNPQATQRVLYLTHWDTRPTADQEEDPADQLKPFDGANDGASGVGLLLALADALQKKPSAFGVDLLFVDGEDYGDFSTNTDVLLGSQHFASNLPNSRYAPVFGVLFDMIGDADLRIPQEINSVQRAPDVVQRVWSKAADMGRGAIFVTRAGEQITDDHIPLLDVGLKVIDVIDLDYGPGNAYHHTRKDTMDKLSAESLKAVGDVALALLR